MINAVLNSSKSNGLPDQLGRFKPLGILGKGAQGIVYLANDPQLDRKVAIKTISQGGLNKSQLVKEARNVSQLQHANIVTLYEIGTHGEYSYLVYQYINGMSLRKVLDETPVLPVLYAVQMIIQVLDGLSYAHEKDIIHRDLNPTNIFVDKNGTPKIMDFSISTLSGNDSSNNEVIGAASYMSPEQINGNTVGPYSDVFSLGIVLFEMLTGVSIFSANNSMATMYKVINENILPPSHRNNAIDQELDRIALTALSRSIQGRYKDAQEFKAELVLYTKRECGDIDTGVVATDSGESTEKQTLTILHRNMQRKKDFPAVAQHVTQIMQQTNRSASAKQLAKVILNDQSLTSKILRLVNSSAYCHFGGEIRTISRAVVILGVEHVRSISVGIIMFQHLQNSTQVDALMSNACNSYLSAMLAKSLAGTINSLEPEEAFIASMFHKFGRQITIYYLAEEYDEIQNLIRHKGMKEGAAVTRVLGLSYTKLGRSIAKEWDLPENILKGLSQPHEGIVPKPNTRDEIIAQLSAFTNEIADIAGSDKINKKKALENVSNRYKRSFDLDADKIIKLVTLFIDDVNEFARALGIDAGKTIYYKNLLAFMDPDSSKRDIEAVENIQNDEGTADNTHASEEVLAKGIAEVANMLFTEYELNIILPTILKFICSGLECRRAMLLLKEKISHSMHARLGFGDGVNELIPSFHFQCSEADDVFNEAVNECKDIIIQDTNDKDILQRVPDWCRRAATPNDMVLLPATINGNCIGLIYIDNIKTNLSPEILTYLDTFRKQIAMSIKQKLKN
ncbi:MAG: HDOD domain-containing protein [Gammaproteobacteria bacterium]|nr:HDOD domain-containing protein [Gammaproteobacteria bacterium]